MQCSCIAFSVVKIIINKVVIILIRKHFSILTKQIYANGFHLIRIHGAREANSFTLSRHLILLSYLKVAVSFMMKFNRTRSFLKHTTQQQQRQQQFLIWRQTQHCQIR